MMKKKKLKKQVGSGRSSDSNSCPKDCPEDSEENLIGSSTGASRNVICGSDGNTYRYAVKDIYMPIWETQIGRI